MKKHITIIALALISLATVFTACNKSDDKTESKKYNVYYELNNTNPEGGVTLTLSPCFKADITYTDANGQPVELKDITLPWEKEITVEAPFDASFSAQLTFKEEELPDVVTVAGVSRLGIKKVSENAFVYIKENKSGVSSKEQFLTHISNQPRYLKFGLQKSIE